MGRPHPGTKMDRVLVGIAIALAALFLSGGFMRDVMAADRGAAAPELAVKSPPPVTNGLRSEQVMSLLLTLEALRAVPDLFERHARVSSLLT
jgi:hypothetical protein